MQRNRKETGTGPKTQDISAPDEFWAFFKNHSLAPEVKAEAFPSQLRVSQEAER